MRIARQEELDRITELLTDLSRYISIKNENGEYGINGTLENLLRGFFDILFDCRLKNLNYYQKNFPAVDLGDYDKRIAIQVTTEDISTKMKEVVDRIKKNKIYNDFDNIYIFFCTAKEKPTARKNSWSDQEKINSATKPEFFLPKDHVLFIEDIYRILSLTKDLDQIHRARKYLERNLPERKTKFRIISFGMVCGMIGMAVILAMMLSRVSVLSPDINQEMDSHLLLELENANHQYEEGLENWRRLDYNRADRDICGALEEISHHLSQAEVEVAKINNSLGCLYLDMGRYEEAYDFLNSAFVTFKDVFGEGSREERTSMFSIAQYDYYTGNFETALKMAQKIMDKSDPEEDMVIIAAVSHFRAMIFDSLGDYDSAISVYQELLTSFEDILRDGGRSEELSAYVHDPALDQGEKDYYTNTLKWIILTYNNMGQVYIHLEKYDEASEALQTGLELSLDNIYIGKQNLTASKLYYNLAIVYARQGKQKEAIDSIDLAMRIQQKLFDYEAVYPGLVEVYDIYGTLLTEQGKDEEAEEYFHNALSLAQKSFGENHPKTAEAYNALGSYWFDQGEYEEAADAFEHAVLIRKNILGKEHPDTVEFYINLAKTQIRLGKNSDACEMLAEAEVICNKFHITGRLPEQIQKYQREALWHE